MAGSRKTMGIGASVSVLSKYLHPSEHIRNRFPNPERGHRLSGLLVVGQGAHTINRKAIEDAVEMRHDDFPNIIFYCIKRFARVETEGPPESFFANAGNNDGDNTGVDDAPNPEIPEEILAVANSGGAGGFLDDTDRLLAANLVETDDDNQPAPENIPTPGVDNAAPTGEWGHDNVCERLKGNVRNVNATISLSREVTPTPLLLFELFFFGNFVKNVILPNINAKMGNSEAVQYGEFLRWIGLWLIMSTIHGPTRREYWSRQPIDPFSGAPFRLDHYMSRTRFEAILSAISYSSVDPPEYKDPFHPIRQMVVAWNENMAAVFSPSWVSCLDESMSFWTNMYTCPGFMFVPRKPWPFGNEFHTICCALSGIMWQVELVEGKDRPSQMPTPEYENLGGKTVGLLLRLTRPIWHQGKVIILDSGFCVTKALTELRKKGVFAAALIKKRRYWPKNIDGDAIKNRFVDKPVGHTDSYRLMLDGTKLDVHGFKEPDYVMMFMSTYGTTARVGGEKKRIVGNSTISFQYPELVHNHFQYRHAVDDHNNRRQSPISIERTWKTNYWPHRVFAFLLSITEINVLLAWTKMFHNPDIGTLEFRKLLAGQLIDNFHWQREVDERERQERESGRPNRRRPGSTGSGHAMLHLPPYSKFQGATIVESTSQYPQKKCMTCSKKVRTYCTCSPGLIRCHDCFGEHVAEVIMDDEGGE